MVLSFSSCYKDTSTLAENEIEAIKLDTAGIEPQLFVEFNEELVLSPKFTPKEGQKVSYIWSISEKDKMAYDTKMKVIGNELELKYNVERPISNSPYILKLVVRDDSHQGLEYIYTWDLTVNSPYITGLLVADSKDGQKTDFTYIKHKDLSPNYKKDEFVIRNVLTDISNAGAINGQVKKLYYTSLGRQWSKHTALLWALTEEGKLYRYKTQSFDLDGDSDKDNLILFKPTADFKFASLFKAGPSLFAETTSGYYSFPAEQLSVFTTVDSYLKEAKMKNSIVAFTSKSDLKSNYLIWFDENKNAFMSLSSAGKILAVDNFEKTDAFDPNNLEGLTPLAGEIGDDHFKASFLMKGADDSYAIYTLELAKKGKKGLASGKYKVPSSFIPQMTKAKSFFFSKLNQTLYVAVDKAIYTISYGAGEEAIVDETPIYTIKEGETIDFAKLFIQGQYAANSSEMRFLKLYGIPPLAFNLNALIVASHSSADKGFVKVLPLGEGGKSILQDKALSYDGFAKVLDVISIGM